MKYLLPVILLNLAFSFLAEAQECSVEDHKAAFEAIYENSVHQSLAQLKSRKGVAMKAATLNLTVRATEIYDPDREKIGFFVPDLEIFGYFTTESGAEMWVAAKGEPVSGYAPSEMNDLMFYTHLLSRGFNREGSAIDPKCRLTTTGHLEIINKKTNRVVTTFKLPQTVTIDISEKK